MCSKKFNISLISNEATQQQKSTDTNNGTEIKPTMENSVATRCLWFGNRIELKKQKKQILMLLSSRTHISA
jgi:hypothetical protein